MRQAGTIFINNQWVTPLESGDAIDVVNPATERVIGNTPTCGAMDVDRAVSAARAAQRKWAELSPTQRGAFIAAIAEGLASRADELAAVITAEVGMPVKLTRRVQVDGPIYAWRQYARLAAEFAFEAQVGNSRVVREPQGVAACITPWNYPLHQITCKVAPALAAGCTVVLKPAETTPGCALILAEVVKASGLPEGVFNMVTGTGPEAGEALVAHLHVDIVSFTGSTQAGQRVAEIAAQSLKRVTLELGGKSAAIVLDDADYPAAVKGIVSACFLNSGQTCSAHTRMLVPASRYEEVKALIAGVVAGYTVGDPEDPATRIGPVANRRQYERVRQYIDAGLESGAELLAGGNDRSAMPAQGYYVQPTVFGRVSPQSLIAREEIFGPVLSILCFDDEGDAIRIANDSDYGLSGGVWSQDLERAVQVALRLQTGQVDINGAPFNLQAPFGGYKKSGQGRENGVYGMEEFLQYKAIQMPVPRKSAV